MRIISSLIILFALLSAVACVKRPSTSPVPVIEYLDFSSGKTVANNDTAMLVIGYEDGNGDIFRDRATGLQGPNVIGTFYYYNNGTKSFLPLYPDPITLDTFRVTQTIYQPDEENSYKGKAVRGRIELPWAPFRSHDSIKVFKYTVFVVDDEGNRSNSITTPQFTVTF